jgi:putative hydrolase of the HAD superfamily
VAIGVVSNTTFSERVIRYELERHGLTAHLAFIMVSAEYAVRKPNVLLFETAAARLGIEPRDIWFVGDRLDMDAAGARAAGMTAVWFNPRLASAPVADAADLIVSGWDEILRLFLEFRA